jgi:phosphoribosylformylglycinamidine synthase
MATMTAPSLTDPTTPEIAREHGLSPAEWDVILDRLGRPPNLVELGIFSVMWSEHCSYKSSRRHLRKLPTTGPRVIQGPGENAGVVDIGGGLAAVFKMESHNHPSFIEPYQGAATGVGGILRDVFTMGARPVALMNALRFGAPEHPKTRRLVAGVVAGIGGYGNCVGVPTLGGETDFHEGYDANILVNAMAVGIAEADKIFYARGAKPGSPIVYVGSKTGRDGIHGATMASAEFDDQSEEKRPTVQVGDPFTEKLLIEACLELMATDAIEAIQDMGAAGLTSSSVEMAGKGDVGVELDLDRVPQRETGMTAYEMMLSESQERMLAILKPGREAEAEAIFKKWELDFAVIGATTTTGRLVLKHRGETVCDIPVAPLSEDAPSYDRPQSPAPKPSPLDPASLPEPEDLAAALKTLLACPDLCSKRWIWEQYDRHVMADTVDNSETQGDAAVVRIHGTTRALAITTDVTPRYCRADPFAGGKQAVAEAFRNLTAVGATPIAITDCLNFGNPERPEVMASFVACIEGMAEACRALDMPVVSGNVSLYNETNGVAIPPTPAVGAVGLLEDLTKRAGIGGLEEEDVLLLVGDTRGELGQSIYLRELFAREDGAPPPVDLAVERRNGDFVRGLIEQGLTRAVHDLSDGGLLVAAAEMALVSNVGLAIDADPPAVSGDGAATPASRAAFLFGEDGARFLVGVRSRRLDDVVEHARAAKVPLFILAQVGGEAVALMADGARIASASLAELRAAHESWLPNYMKSAG